MGSVPLGDDANSPRASVGTTLSVSRDTRPDEVPWAGWTLNLCETIAHLHREASRAARPVDEHLFELTAELGKSIAQLPNAGVIYAVLNHAPWNRERRFNAWLSTKARLPRYYAALPVGTPEYARVVLEDRQDDVGGQLEDAWLRNWSIYTELTSRLENRGLTTWNQLLLRYAERPHTLGLIWGAGRKTDSVYLDCTSSALSRILREFDDPELTELRDIPIDTAEVLRPLISRLQRMKLSTVLADVYQTHANTHDHLPMLAATVVAGLLKYYSHWGGGAFLSIPVWSRGRQPEGVSVLSICSERPFDTATRVCWELVAHALLGPLAGEAMDEKLRGNVSFDDVPPDECHRLAETPLLTGDRWTKPEAFFRSDHPNYNLLGDGRPGFLGQRVVVPGVGSDEMLQILANDLRLPRGSSRSQVTRHITTVMMPPDAGWAQDEFKDTREYLEESVFDRLHGGIARFEGHLQTNIDRVFNTWDTLDANARSHFPKRWGAGRSEVGRVHRVYPGPKYVRKWLHMAMEGMAKHCDERRMGARTSCICGHGSGPCTYWVLLVNPVRKFEGELRKTRGSRSDLGLLGQSLYAIGVVYARLVNGTIDTSEWLWRAGSREHAGLEASEGIASIEGWPEGAVFVTGLVLPCVEVGAEG